MSTAVMPPGAFRLLLALAVVASHISRFDVGRLAVLLFFFLSGYWVLKIWREKFAGQDTLRFYVARYLRIAPLYLIVGALAVLMFKTPFGPESLTLLGVASSNRDPLGISWSLDIELQFYLLLPVLAPLMATRPLATLVGSSVVAAAAWTLQTDIVTVLQYLPAFVLGGLACGTSWRPSERTANLSLAVFLAFSALTALGPFIDKTVADPFDRDIYGFFWMLPLLPYVARSLVVKSGPLDRHLGNLSYPLYLVHFAVIAAATTAFGGSFAVRIAAAAFAVGCAVVLYLAMDRPLDAWRVRLTEGRRQLATS